MGQNQTFIRCEISPGQFKDEAAVTIHLIGGRIITLFADRSLIEEKHGEAFLRVTKIGTADGGDGKEEVVILPTEAFENGSRWLRKTGDQLMAA